MAETSDTAQPGETEPPLFYAGFDEVLKLELSRIESRWQQRTPAGRVDPDNLSGLALSGGGIRSASFAMGAIQKLHKAGVMERLHYMSSVSGGGYTASALTWFLTRGDAAGYSFPFTGGSPAAGRLSVRKDIGETSPAAPLTSLQKRKQGTPLSRIAGRQLVDFIRQRSSYLLPANLGLLSALAVVLRSVLTSLASYFILFSFIALAVLSSIPDPTVLHRVPLLAAGVLAGVLGLMMLGYSILAPLPWGRQTGYGLRRQTQDAGGRLLSFAIFFAVTAAWLFLAVEPNRATRWLTFLAVPEGTGVGTGAAGAGLGVLGGLATRALSKLKSGFWRKILLPVLPALSLFLLVTGLGIGAFGFARWLQGWEGWVAELLLLVGGLTYLLCANLNLTGLNRFYRDRLMECFLPDVDDVLEDQPSQPTDADAAELHSMFPPGHQGPFHIINTNLILFEADHARYRGRRGDSFFLTPLYCGSEATGFVSTKDWLPDRGPWLIRPVGPLTLPTAMAISGAAVNPNTGPGGGTAVTQNPFVSAVLTMLNLRLGYWVPSPQLTLAKGHTSPPPAPGGKPDRRKRRIAYRSSHVLPPNHLWPGLTHGLLGTNRSERSNWLELTDGGHFDNTGIYELVRRRVATIFFIDGGEDPDVSFANFASVAERIFVDFDVTLTFPEPEHSFARLMTGSAPEVDPLAKRFNLAEKGFAVAQTNYPAIGKEEDTGYRPPLTGALYIVKATMTAGLPAALYAYKADHPSFPWESTLDQFFNEQQFEAYRTLGFMLAGQLTDHLYPPSEAVDANLA